MPATKILTIAALLAVTVSVAGCNSKHASSGDAAAAATTAATAPSADAAATSSAASAASAPSAAAGSVSAGCPLTGAQVTGVLGATYADPTVAYGMCSYVSSSTGNAFSIDIHNASGVFDFDATVATAKQDEGTDTTTSLPGLGDKAAGVGQEIVVQADGKTIDIRSVDEAPWTQSIALAKLVIATLH